MAYYLAVERTPNSYEGINIKNTQIGRKIFSNSTDECTLEEIDKFTTQYTSLEKLAYELYTEKKITWPNSSLAIVSVSGINIKIEDGMLFFESRKYLDNPDRVRDYLLMKFQHSSLEFYRELSKSLSEKDLIRNKVEKIIEVIESNLVGDKKTTSLDIMPIVDTIIYQLDSEGKPIVPLNYCYENLHNIILAIANHENRIRKDTQSYKRTKTKNT